MGCRVELPRLQPIYERYREQGFDVVAVEGKRDRERALKLVEKEGLTYTLLENGEGEQEVASRLYGVLYYPSSFLLDRDGRVLFFHEGFEEGDEQELEEEIRSLL